MVRKGKEMVRQCQISVRYVSEDGPEHVQEYCQKMARTESENSQKIVRKWSENVQKMVRKWSGCRLFLLDWNLKKILDIVI